MLKIALAMTLLVSSSMAYALNNSDLIQLNLRMSRQKEGQQADMKPLSEPMEQARLRQGEYLQDIMWRQQQEQLKQKQYLQEMLLERQRLQGAHRFVEQREQELIIHREQPGLFQ